MNIYTYKKRIIETLAPAQLRSFTSEQINKVKDSYVINKENKALFLEKIENTKE